MKKIEEGHKNTILPSNNTDLQKINLVHNFVWPLLMVYKKSHSLP